MTTTSEIFEAYLLATDKEAYLESIKTTSEFNKLKFHHCVNHGIDLPENLKHMISRHTSSPDALKFALIELESATDQAKKVEILNYINQYYLGTYHHHQRENGSTGVAGHTEGVEVELNSKLSSYTSAHTDVDKIIEGYYTNIHVVHSFNEVGMSNLHKIDILRLQKANSQINLLRLLPNYLYTDNIVNVLQSVQKNYQEENI